MAGAECELITALRVWGRSLQRGPRAEPLVRGQGAKPPLKLKAFCLLQVQVGRKVAHCCYLVNCSNMLFEKNIVAFSC